jgi:hypothetical protein
MRMETLVLLPLAAMLLATGGSAHGPSPARLIAPLFTPGQAAVLYAGERVLGGGWITETERAEVALAA